MKILAKDLEKIYGIKNEFMTYGSNKFDINKFDSIKNRDFIKPHGGLWSSPVNSSYGWKDWCESEGYKVESLSSWFKFKLNCNSNIFVIDELSDLINLMKIYRRTDQYLYFENVLDFEKISKDYDGILLTDNGERKTRYSDPELYGWDCESLLVFNPEVIEVVGE